MVPTHLACTVRDCGLPLCRLARAVACANGHTFDVARSGYINLLQAQDRRSKTPGDAAPAVEARARLLAGGVGLGVVHRVAARAAALQLPMGALVADLGCGSGELLGALASTGAVEAVGIDLSTAAATFAARRYPTVTWVVANADRRLPLVDGSVHLVVSIHGRRHPAECARVLVPEGRLLVGVPAADDLAELRDAVHGAPTARDRTDAVVAEHAARFTLVDRDTVRDCRRLDTSVLHDLLRATYRGARASVTPQVAALSGMEVTLATDLLLFARR